MYACFFALPHLQCVYLQSAEVRGMRFTDIRAKTSSRNDMLAMIQANAEAAAAQEAAEAH